MRENLLIRKIVTLAAYNDARNVTRAQQGQQAVIMCNVG